METRATFLINPELTQDLPALRKRVVDTLKRMGFRGLGASRTRNGLSVTGHRGTRTTGVLSKFVPFNQQLGLFTRVGVRVVAKPSLDPGDDRAFFHVRVWPEDEVWGTAEQWPLTQSDDERGGDAWNIRRVRNRIAHAFQAAGMIAGKPQKEAALPAGDTSRFLSLIGCWAALGIGGIGYQCGLRPATIVTLCTASLVVFLGLGIHGLVVAPDRRTRSHATTGIALNAVFIVAIVVVVVALASGR